MSNHEKVKFLIDENVEFSIVKLLRDKRFDIISIAEDFKSSEDTKILQVAYSQNRIIITNDKDFGYLIFNEKLASNGVILFRFVTENAEIKTNIFGKFLEDHLDFLYGNFITLSENKIRIRKIKQT